MSTAPFIVLEHGLLTALKRSGKTHAVATAIVQAPAVEEWLRSLSGRAPHTKALSAVPPEQEVPLTALVDALQEARNGLLWYRDRFPEAEDGSDFETMERIDAALVLAASPRPLAEPEPIGHLHSNGDFCADSMPRGVTSWPVPLYAAAGGDSPRPLVSPIEIRLNEDRTLDEVVGGQGIHLEQMSPTHWWMAVYDGSEEGRVTVNFHARGKITANVERDGAAAPVLGPTVPTVVWPLVEDTVMGDSAPPDPVVAALRSMDSEPWSEKSLRVAFERAEIAWHDDPNDDSRNVMLEAKVAWLEAKVRDAQIGAQAAAGSAG